METALSKEFLSKLGVGASIVTAVFVLGGAFFIYRTYLETTLVKLQIEQLEKELSTNI